MNYETYGLHPMKVNLSYIMITLQISRIYTYYNYHYFCYYYWYYHYDYVIIIITIIIIVNSTFEIRAFRLT